MHFVIDGYDIGDVIASNGIVRTKNDIDGPNAGRTMDGMMHRDIVATKIKLEVTTLPMTGEKLGKLLSMLDGATHYVRYKDPSGYVTRTMYNSTVPSTMAIINSDGDDMWDSIKFSLIEV